MSMISNQNDHFAEITRISRKKNFLLPRLAVMVAIFLGFASNSSATWQKIYSQPLAHPFRACFFLSESVGFVAGDIEDGVYKTTDGGQTWSVTKLPINPTGDAPSGYFTQILMTDAQNGWLTCEQADTVGRPALYQTIDGGASWIPTGVTGRASDIYISPSAIILTNRLESGTGFVSWNGGFSFRNAIPVTNGVDFVDDLNGVATGFTEQVWYHSIDGGLTWTGLSQADTIETWSIYAEKGTPNFFTAGENDPKYGGLSSVRRSSDYGASWFKVSTLPFETTGHIAGFGATLYVQVDTTGGYPGFAGIYSSSDSGRSWLSIGGPSSDEDTRFAVLGCRGEVIYAFDGGGNIWKTVDGGNGSLPQFQFPSSPLAVDSIDVCGPRDTIIEIKNLGCDTMYLTNASAPPMPVLGILDPATGKAPNLPLTILPHSTGMLKLILQASLAGTYQTIVELEIVHDGVLDFDTISVTSALKYFNPLRALSNIHFDSTTLCETSDTTLTIQNDSCFTVQIVSSQLKSGVNYVLDSVYKNDSIAAFSTKTYGIAFSPTQVGKDVDSLIVNFLVLGKPLRMSFPVVGTGKQDMPQLVMADRFGNPLPSVIDFDTITRCQDSTFAFTISEKGCDTLFTTFEWLDSSKTGSPPSAQFKWVTLPNRWITHDTVIDGIEALGTVLGSYQGYFRITDSSKGVTSATVQYIPFKVFVKPGTRTLSLDDSPRNFDTIGFCDTNERTIVIQNLGCDTIHDSSMTLSDPNFIFVVPPKFPLVVDPNSSISVTVRYLPVVSGEASGLLSIITDADSAPERIIPLLGYAIPTDTIKFKALATNLTVAPGDTSTINILAGNSFKAKGLNTINMTLAYNGNILTLYNPSKTVTTGIPGANIVSTPDLPIGNTAYLQIAIGGTNMQLDSTVPIASMKFLISLSDSTSTDFRLTNFQLNDANFNKCTLGSAIDTGTIKLEFLCGDSLMYNLLRYGTNFAPGDGIAPVSGVVYPDPVTSSTLFIPYRALRAVSVGLEIMDWSGAVVYSSVQYAPAAGATEFEITGLSLASGAYHYRLHPLDNGRISATGGFVVLR